MSREPQAEDARASDQALGRELSRLGHSEIEHLPELGALHAAIEAEIGREHGPIAFLRSRSTPLRVGSALLLLSGLALVALRVAGRVDLELYPAARMQLSVGLMSVGFLVSVWLALWPLSRPSPPPVARRSALALVPISLLVLYALPAAHTDHPASLQQPGAVALLLRALPCLGIGLTIALGVVGLLRVFDRGGSAALLLLASAGGVAANLLLQLHCPVTAPAHMLLGHLGVALLVLAVAAAVEHWLPPRR